jgi:hypothetical protein
MTEDQKTGEVERLLSEKNSLEARKDALIDELLKQRVSRLIANSGKCKPRREARQKVRSSRE